MREAYVVGFGGAAGSGKTTAANLLAGKNGNLERFYYLKIAKKTNY